MKHTVAAHLLEADKVAGFQDYCCLYHCIFPKDHHLRKPGKSR